MQTEYYVSAGSGRILARKWFPDTQPKAIVQIVHGIAEHTLRYDDYASWLNEQGIAVVAEDHMGHGGSVGEEGIVGYFHGGWFNAVADTYHMDGIYYIKTWLNEGSLTVGDDIMYVLIGGDIRPHVVDALQYLVGRLKNECVSETELN